MNRRGLTLIELLAVITLITMVAGVALAGLSSGSEEARLRAATADVVALDAHARRSAERHGAVALERVDPDRLRLTNASGQVANLSLRHGVEVQILVNEAPVNAIGVDALGRSDDYEIRVTLNGLERRIVVAGLTGWTEESAP